MSAPNTPRTVRYELYAARAIHDAEFRQLMTDYGISPEGSIKDVKERLAALDAREFQQFVIEVQNADLKRPSADRNNAVLYQVNELSNDLWLREKTQLSEQAEKIMNGRVAEARAELSKGNLDRFHEQLPDIRDDVQEFSASIRDARHRIGDEMRNFLFSADADMTREQRRNLIDEKLLDHTIPPNMQAVLALENTLAQEEVDFVMKQQQRENERNAAPTPRAQLAP